MPQGDKSSYTAKQKRKAEHIEESYEKRGVGKREAEERAWRTVNKQDGGARKKRGGAKKSTRARSRKSTGSRKRSGARSSSSRRRAPSRSRSTARSRS